MSRRDIGTDDLRVHVRPGKGSRPRSKIRPDYSSARRGRVTAVDRGRYAVTMLDDGVCVTAVKARELPRGSVVVGDICAVVGDLSGRKDTLARITLIDERRTALRRTAEDGDSAGHERVIVANADQLMIVTALAQPEPRLGFIDRCLVAAYDAGLEPILVLTKADLADPTELLAHYEPLDIRILVCARTDDKDIHLGSETDKDILHEHYAGVDDIFAAITGHVSVFIGHSGVGKSTLINALVPHADRATGGVNDVTGKGRHTSTSAMAFEILPEQPASPAMHTSATIVIDTPGVRSFGLAHVSSDSLLKGFPDLHRIADDCPRGCLHHKGELGCLLGHLDEPRLVARTESFWRLLEAVDKQDWE